MTLLRDLKHCSAGNVAVIFSIAVVPLLLAAGAGVDMIRANQARTVLQGAADAAALAGGSSDQTDAAVLEKIAMDYLMANGVEDAVANIDKINIQDNSGTGAFKVEIKGKVKTSFMMLAGFPTMNVDAVSEVKRGASGPLEMVLALDTTYSMIENDKIGTLKTAATDLVNSVMATGNVKAGIVPFADYFKVGMKYKNEPWIDVPPDKTDPPYESCNWDYPDKAGCSYQSSTCYADGVPYSCGGEVCTSWGDPVKSNCTTVSYTYTWQGCVGARPPAYHNSIGDIGVRYPGVLWDCGAAMVDMTTAKTDVINGIESLWPNGNTNIPSGLIWAWNMLTPAAPLTESAPMADINAKGGKKVLVLMTDGVNSSSPYDDGNYGPHASTSYGDGTYTDNLTAELCQKIKAEGVLVYTVLFDVSDPKIESLLEGCASSSDNSFVAADAAALKAAFKNIGVSLTQLRLTK